MPMPKAARVAIMPILNLAEAVLSAPFTIDAEVAGIVVGDMILLVVVVLPFWNEVVLLDRLADTVDVTDALTFSRLERSSWNEGISTPTTEQIVRAYRSVCC